MRGGCEARRGCFTCNSACRSRLWLPINGRLIRAPLSADVSRETQRRRWRKGPRARRSHRLLMRIGTTTPENAPGTSGAGRVRSRTAADLRPGAQWPFRVSVSARERSARRSHQHGSTLPDSWGRDFLMVRRSTPHKHHANDSWRRRRLAPSKRAPSEPRYPLLADRHASAAPEPCQTPPW